MPKASRQTTKETQTTNYMMASGNFRVRLSKIACACSSAKAGQSGKNERGTRKLKSPNAQAYKGKETSFYAYAFGDLL